MCSKKKAGRRRILFLSQCLPYPPTSGVTRRTYNIIQQLAKDFDVTLLAFFRRNHQPDKAQVCAARGSLSEIIDVAEPVAISSEQSRWKFARTHLASIMTGEAYTYYEYGDRRFMSQLESELDANRPDLVHVDSMDLYRCLNRLKGLPVACTHHSIESELLRLRAPRLQNPLVRSYASWQARRIEEVEREYAPTVDVNVMMSEVDAKRLRKLAPNARTAVIPNGVDHEKFAGGSPMPADSNEVVFLGPLYMYPNWDGISYFVRESWPRVRHENPAARLTLIGKTSERHRSELEAVEGVRVLGFVPDIRPYLAGARCCIAPLRIGGGTRLKILEYWAMGRPVVSTTIGCEGLSVRDGHNVLIRDDPEEFAAAVLKVLSDPSAAGALGANARATVESKYTWERIGCEIRRLYHSLVGRGEGRNSASA